MSTPVTAPTILYRVQLQDEIPAVGTGQRWVFVREGQKWAFVLCPFTANTVRVPLTTWRRIKSYTWGSGDYIREYLRGRIKSLGREPTAFEQSALEA